MNQQRASASPPPPTAYPGPQAQQPQQQYPLGAQPAPNLADWYSMFNQYMGAQGAAGGVNPMSPTPFPPTLARPAADGRPIEERYQVISLDI